jgi:hypothetical protein
LHSAGWRTRAVLPFHYAAMLAMSSSCLESETIPRTRAQNTNAWRLANRGSKNILPFPSPNLHSLPNSDGTNAAVAFASMQMCFNDAPFPCRHYTTPSADSEILKFDSLTCLQQQRWLQHTAGAALNVLSFQTLGFGVPPRGICRPWRLTRPERGCGAGIESAGCANNPDEARLWCCFPNLELAGEAA